MPHRFQGIVDLTYILSQQGLTKAVVSPGSRNVPLINAFIQNPGIECISVVDERSAGYYAMGLALKLQQPVVLFCTSGTATLNYAPAIAEAYHQKVPLIVLTADRPPELIGQRDNQTINQVGIYQNFIEKVFLFPTETEKDVDLNYAHRIANEAAALAKYSRKPVHVNVPLREPLYVELPNTSQVKLIKHQSNNVKYELPNELIEIWNNSFRKIILVGQGNNDLKLEAALQQMSKDGSVLILAENLSNIHFQEAISAVERLFLFLRSNPSDAYTPDLIITLGGNVVSKQLKLFFREHKPNNHWNISDDSEMVDTFNSLTQAINANPTDVFSVLSNLNSDTKINYKQTMLEIDEKLEQHQKEYIKSIEFSDMLLYDKVMESLPPDSVLHLGNSTPIRYSQLFKTKQTVNYFSNRGVSGIDGCISTVAGYAKESSNINLLIIGDISFLYDSNALWIQSLSNYLRIIVINNGGGDIFRWINTSENNDLDAFIETPQNVNIELLTKACSLEYLFADDLETFICTLKKFYEPSEKAIVFEVNTAKQQNAEIVRTLYKSFKEYRNEQY